MSSDPSPIKSQNNLDVSGANIGRRYPERIIAGFSRKSSTVIFYSIIRALVKPSWVVLDLGAGRGGQGQGGSEFMRDIVNFKGKVAQIADVDVDSAVLENPMLDEAHVVAPGARLPFEDQTSDLIFSDWVLEHIDDPTSFSAEVHRLLKPGSWFCGRTPNRFGMIAIAASMVPNRLHSRVLNMVQPDRYDRDMFPTRYRLNTKGAVKKFFPTSTWENNSFQLDTEVMYLTRYRFLFELVERLSKLLPGALLPVLLVFVQKKPSRA